jgi:hypothetical protein
MLRGFSQFSRSKSSPKVDRLGMKKTSAPLTGGFCSRYARSFEHDDTERLDKFAGLNDLLSSLESFRE